MKKIVSIICVVGILLSLCLMQTSAAEVRLIKERLNVDIDVGVTGGGYETIWYTSAGGRTFISTETGKFIDADTCRTILNFNDYPLETNYLPFVKPVELSDKIIFILSTEENKATCLVDENGELIRTFTGPKFVYPLSGNLFEVSQRILIDEDEYIWEDVSNIYDISKDEIIETTYYGGISGFSSEGGFGRTSYKDTKYYWIDANGIKTSKYVTVDSEQNIYNYLGEGLFALGPCYKLSGTSYFGDAGGMIDKNGNIVVPCEYANMYPFSDGLALVRRRVLDAWGFINKFGETVIPFTYWNADSFENGVARVEKRDENGDIEEFYINTQNERVAGYNTTDIDSVYFCYPPFPDYEFDEVLTINETGDTFDFSGTGLRAYVFGNKDEYVFAVDKNGIWYRLSFAEQNKNFENITFSNKTYTYNGLEQSIGISGTLPEGATVTYTNEKGKNAGTYRAKAVIEAAGYNTLTLNATMTIKPAPIAVKAKDITIRTGESIPSFNENSYEITSGQLFGTDAMTGNLTTNCRSTAVAKTFAISKGTLSAGTNYNMSFTNGVLKVVDKTPQNIVVSDITAKTYGDAPFQVTVTPDETSGLTAFTFTSSNPAVAEIDASGNVTIKAAGTTDITVSQAGDADYAAFERKQTLTVNKVAITVTADAKTKKIGTVDPALTYTFTGTLVGEDTFSGALSRKSGEAVGRYDILQGTLSLGNNYAITFNKAVFEIVEKTPQNIAFADIPAKTYGDAPFALDVTPDSTANLSAFTYTSSDESVATVDAAGNVTIVGAGETAITINEAGNADFATFSATKQLVVTKKTVAVTSVNLDEKTAVLEGVLPADTAVELDFNAVALEITGTVDETTSNVVITNFALKGEKAENYTVSTESLDTTVTTANTASVGIVSENGTAVGAGTYLKGSNITVSVTANSGYKFNGWFAGEEKVSANAEYSFVVDGDVELEARIAKKSSGGGGAFLPGASKPAEPTPVKPSEPSESEDPVSGEPTENGAASFTDISKETYAWAYDGIDALAKAGVFKGMTPTTFGPELTATNAQVVALAVRIAGLKATNGATTGLVAGDHWVYAEMATAESAGILGVFGGNVAVEEATTREVAFTLLYNALKAAGVELAETAEAIEYTDASGIDAACVEAITALTKAGIVNGMGDGTLQPKATVTRAQLAKILGIAQTLIK